MLGKREDSDSFEKVHPLLRDLPMIDEHLVPFAPTEFEGADLVSAYVLNKSDCDNRREKGNDALLMQAWMELSLLFFFFFFQITADHNCEDVRRNTCFPCSSITLLDTKLTTQQLILQVRM